MDDTKKVADLLQHHLSQMMSKYTLYVVNVSKDILWNTYITSFKPEHDPIYIKNTIHTCATCKQVIKQIGNVVAITDDNKIVSIWDIDVDDDVYTPVFKTMSKLVHASSVISIFLSSQKKYGTKETFTIDATSNKPIRFYHFHITLDSKYYQKDAVQKIANSKILYSTTLRALTEISLSAIDIVLELIKENNLYRGKEFEQILKKFRKIKVEYENIEQNKNLFIWKKINSIASSIHNSSIGTLLLDISNNIDITNAVKSFENKIAPLNYKRTKSIVTEFQKKKFIEEIDKEGIRNSLYRRHAIASDISINDILFIDRNIRIKDNDPLFDMLGIEQEIKKLDIKKLSNIQEITIENFINKILPNSKKIYLVSSRSFDTNQVYISAPKIENAPNIFKWNNKFAWSYIGNITDSDITQNVKAKGGKTDGVLRFSLQWNDNNLDNIDLDAHCNISIKSNRYKIYYGKAICSHNNIKGSLDIDITTPGNKIAVENIVFDKVTDGTYLFKVHNFSNVNSLTDMFQCEIVFKNTTFRYKYTGQMLPRQFIPIATITVKNSNFTIKHHLPYNEDTSGQLIPIDMVMLSSNHWLGEKKGNKHYFFITKHVVAKEPFRGFYNEFLDFKYNKFRKSFDLLGSLIKCEPNEDGLSGYGFSETLKKEIYLKADENMYKVKIGG